ncbi:MAG TPA: flagellar motor switch protein FliM [Candidatus Kapabacteria bacterium]|nr:flagellar motor switch protein FliM [Candidatus Kapabacteria bacterium]HPO61547.1 flagellar motor switch protein FliM [Candidatus Kapabacteria bacterium]
MADVLSQHEIDNLLNEMTSGNVDVDQLLSGKYQKSDITNYDFRRPNRISKNQVRTLHTIHESFAEVFSYFLVSKLQTVVSISVTSVDQLFYSEFILSVSNPSCIYVFDIEGTDGSGIMEIQPQLALSIIERLLGGTADTETKSRTITPIEQAVIRGVVEHALSDLRNSWRSIADLSFTYQRLEMEADFVQIAPSSEIVVVVSFDVNIGAHTYLMNLCFPTFALEEVLARLNRQQVTTTAFKSSPQRIRENIEIMKMQMATTYLPIIAELGKTSITVGELLSLRQGDILRLNKKVNQEIEIVISGRRKLAARPGSVDGKKAVRVMRPLKEEELVDQDLTYKPEEI